MPTKVIHIKDAPAGWRNNSDFVYCGRPSRWGNPFTVQQLGRDKACNRFEAWFPTQKELVDALHELKGKTLVCFCKPLRCHCDYLKGWADALPDAAG